ncbi:hypothetical protein BJF90_32040 [Pseudonocardia sp. CNS-004]|nr:hypothetical protein BJF90_32040 [Pseudonocardia sp. CNS-004]
MSAPDAEHEAMTDAARLLDLDSVGARLVSASSRLIWHLPGPGVALTISRPGTKTGEDVAAETAAMRAATAAGVRTPGLRSGPIALPVGRWAFAADWITGHRPGPADWPAIAAAAAKLADAPTAHIHPLAWPDGLDDPQIGSVLGGELHDDLIDRAAAAAHTFDKLLTDQSPVLAHTDLQPANVLCNEAGAWLLDLEYASLAPREWDPAKLVILARRFGDPADVEILLDAWACPDRSRLADCVDVQEVLLVVWLARMATRGTQAAAGEARHRAGSLGERCVRWRHLA